MATFPHALATRRLPRLGSVPGGPWAATGCAAGRQPRFSQRLARRPGVRSTARSRSWGSGCPLAALRPPSPCKADPGPGCRAALRPPLQDGVSLPLGTDAPRALPQVFGVSGPRRLVERPFYALMCMGSTCEVSLSAGSALAGRCGGRRCPTHHGRSWRLSTLGGAGRA